MGFIDPHLMPIMWLIFIIKIKSLQSMMFLKMYFLSAHMTCGRYQMK